MQITVILNTKLCGKNSVRENLYFQVYEQPLGWKLNATNQFLSSPTLHCSFSSLTCVSV